MREKVTSIKIVCDRCGEEKAETEVWSGKLAKDRKEKRFDMCDSCVTEDIPNVPDSPRMGRAQKEAA